MNINELATIMNVPEEDAQSFVNCLRIWIEKGYTVDQAIEKHIDQMKRFVDNAVPLSVSMKKTAVEWLCE